MKRIKKILKQLNCSNEYIEGFFEFHKVGMESEHFQKEILTVSRKDLMEGVKGMKVAYDFFRASVFAETNGTDAQKEAMNKMLKDMMTFIGR